MGYVIKFPDQGRIARFGRNAGEESATIIILPVVRVERHADMRSEFAEPKKHPPAANGGRRRVKRR